MQLNRSSHRTLRKFSRDWSAAGWIICALILVLGVEPCVWSAEPSVNLSAHDLNFSPQAQGTPSAMQVVVLTNSGGADLSITEFVITGQNQVDFAQTNNCPSAPSVLAALGHCEIRLIFSPTLTGTLIAALNISDNASGSPQTINLKGISTAPGPSPVFAPANLVFENEAVGATSVTKVIILTNAGSATLNVNSEINISGPNSGEFHIQAVKSGCPSGTWQLAPKASCEISVIFAPLAIGMKSAQISITDDAPGSPHSVGLSGTGTGPPPANPKN